MDLVIGGIKYPAYLNKLTLQLKNSMFLSVVNFCIIFYVHVNIAYINVP